MAIWVSADHHMQLLVGNDEKGYTLVCGCPKSRKRASGSCKHTDAVMEQVRTEYRSRITIESMTPPHGHPQKSTVDNSPTAG